jgi:hypothetical protein
LGFGGLNKEWLNWHLSVLLLSEKKELGGDEFFLAIAQS